jgi:hypothetical protein
MRGKRDQSYFRRGMSEHPYFMRGIKEQLFLLERNARTNWQFSVDVCSR